MLAGMTIDVKRYLTVFARSGTLTESSVSKEPWTVQDFIPLSYLTPSDEQRAIIDLLTRMGQDDFAEIRHAPPLLYHNDLTAHVSRYYWSEDFGYALWLRLYDAVAAGNESSKQP